MSEWTPEPWKVDTFIGCDHVDIRDADGRRIAVVAGTYPMSIKREDANARRIVACVNACAGIPTECLGDDDWQTLMTSRKERDALRDSLRDIATIAHEGGLKNMSESDALIAIREKTLLYWEKAHDYNKQREEKR